MCSAAASLGGSRAALRSRNMPCFVLKIYHARKILHARKNSCSLRREATTETRGRRSTPPLKTSARNWSLLRKRLLLASTAVASRAIACEASFDLAEDDGYPTPARALHPRAGNLASRSSKVGPADKPSRQIGVKPAGAFSRSGPGNPEGGLLFQECLRVSPGGAAARAVGLRTRLSITSCVEESLRASLRRERRCGLGDHFARPSQAGRYTNGAGGCLFRSRRWGAAALAAVVIRRKKQVPRSLILRKPLLGGRHEVGGLHRSPCTALEKICFVTGGSSAARHHYEGAWR